MLVSCPGADPHETWMRDPLVKDFFRRSPTLHNNLDQCSDTQKARKRISSLPSQAAQSKETRIAHSWARSGVRHAVSTARVLTYDHGDLTENRTLKVMADDLLSSLCTERAGKITRRPLFFICHSIGGLVVKLALTQASRHGRYRFILEDCYGVTFFATPHHGSSYLSIGDFGASIQRLLRLSEPLPPKLRDELKLDNPPLLKIDDDFKQLSSEFQVWSFHETEDSGLSRTGSAGPADIPFKAPITSMRSAILGVRHEKVYALRSTHANCASFGMKNAQTLKLYLSDLGNAIQNAESLNQNTTHVPLNLEQRVMIEVHGVYESGLVDVSSTESTGTRLFSTKEHSLETFWEEGPNGLLERRLEDIRLESHNDPQDTRFVGQKGRALSLRRPSRVTAGIDEHRSRTRPSSVTIVTPGTLSATTGRKASEKFADEPPGGGNMVQEKIQFDKTEGGNRPPNAQSPSRLRASSWAHGLSATEDSGPRSSILVSPRHEAANASMSRSNTGSETLVSELSLGDGPSRPQPVRRGSSQLSVRHYLEPTVPAARERRGSESTFIQDLRIGSAASKPTSKTRKYVWVHVPFNNPVWVRKVFETIALKERQDYSEIFSAEHWSSRHERGRHAQHHACFLKPACGYVPLKAKQPSTLPGQPAPSARGLQRAESSFTRASCLYLYFPFLHFDSYKMLVKRRDTIKRRTGQGRARPVPSDVAKETSLELRVIWEYLGHDPPYNCRRTLDQYRYPSLHDTRARDDDQMLYKMTKERVSVNGKVPFVSSAPVLRGGDRASTYYEQGYALGYEDDDEDQEHADSESETNEDELDARPEDDVLDGKVLMVDQLWLWAADASEFPG